MPSTLTHIISSLVLLDRWPRLGLAFVTGAAAAFAQAPFGWFPLLWLCIPVLVWLLDSAALGRPAYKAAASMAAVGWTFGFGFFLVTFYWLGAAFLVEADKFAWALPLAVLCLPAGLALFWALACGLVAFVWSDSILRALWLALGLSAAEWLRGTILTGLPWGGFGPALAANNLTMQGLSVVGANTYTLFALSLFSLPLLFTALPRERPLARGTLFVLLALFLALLGFGGYRLSVSSMKGAGARAGEGRPVLRLIQPNIPQKEKWKLENRSWIFNRLLALTSQEDPVTPLDDVDLVIWPESAIPFYLIEQPAALAAIAQALPAKARLLTGALRRETDQPDTVFNAIYQIENDGTIEAAYDKIHLVPFGEYLPLQSALEAMGLEQLTRLKGGFQSGTIRRPFDLAEVGKALPAICYEIAFAAELRDWTARPDWIVNVTNDAWFGNSLGPYQHLHIARMRAVELGLPVIRVANTGISAVIDSYGRLRSHVPLGTDGILQVALPESLPQTLYSRFGDRLFFTIWFVYLLILIVLRRKTPMNSAL